MTNQRDYNQLLGYGTGTQTIANYGCFMVNIYDALKERGLYTGSVGQWNQHLKDIGVYTPTNPTLLNIATLGANSKYFVQGYKEAYSDAGVLKYLAEPGKYILIGEVSAKGIGGTGQHFVKIIRADSTNGKITMTYIDDPWGGLSNQKVTTRYGTYGNILSLRVLEIAKGAEMPDTIQVEKTVFEELVTKATKYDEINKNGYVTKADHDAEVGRKNEEIGNLKKQLADAKVAYDNQALLTDRAKEQLRVEQEAHTKTKKELETAKQLLADCENKPITPPADTQLKGRLNGYNITYVKDGKTYTENYAIDG